MIKIKINDMLIEIEEGKTILEAARANNIYIPTLCYQEKLEPYGGCRMCLVEVEGAVRPVTACTYPCSEGLIVRTDTPYLKELRRYSLELILSEHPYSCLICDRKQECSSFMECIQKEPITLGCKYCTKDGNCELQRLVEELEIKKIPYPFSYRGLEVERYDPFFERDYNLCILCNRCVRACNDLRKAGVIQFQNRGPKTIVGTADGLSHLESDCQFCGACVDACPTGAMRERYSKWAGMPDRKVDSICALCSIGCNLEYNLKEDNIVSTTSNKDQICVRGRFGITRIVYHPKRIATPLIRRGDRIIEVSWEEALKVAADVLNEYNNKLGMIFSPYLTNEAIDSIKLLNIRKLAVSINNLKDYNSIDYNALKMPGVIIAINVDLITDYSVLLLKLKQLWGDNLSIISIDSIKTRISRKELEMLEALINNEDDKLLKYISEEQINRIKDIVKDKNIYLFYEPGNVDIKNIPELVKLIPLHSKTNLLKLKEMVVEGIDEIIEDDGIECLYLIGESPELKKDYKKIIVQDQFLPQFKFDIFLPTATFVEVGGTFIGIDGEVKVIKQVIKPIKQARSDEWIIKELASRLRDSRARDKAEEVLDKVSIVKNKDLTPTKEYPLVMFVRENNYIYRNKLLSSIIKGFERYRNDNVVWINPETAKDYKLSDGDIVKIVGQDKEMNMKLYITRDMPKGVVFVYKDLNKGIKEDDIVRLECIK